MRVPKGSPLIVVVQWSVIVLHTFVELVESAAINVQVTATPSKTPPNSWVTLECKFNLTEKETSIVYWSDNAGDTLYVYEKDANTKIQYGPKYIDPWESGKVRNLSIAQGKHSIMVLVTGCNRSPYTCYVWKDAIEVAQPLRIEISGIPPPVITRQGVQVMEIKDVNVSSPRTFSCRIRDATEPHNISITVTINGMVQNGILKQQSTEDKRRCTYSSDVKRMYNQQAKDKVAITCMVEYASGDVKQTSTEACSAIIAKDRTNCGRNNITKEDCLKDSKCCWDNSIKNVKWCFLRTVATATTPATRQPTNAASIPDGCSVTPCETNEVCVGDKMCMCKTNFVRDDSNKLCKESSKKRPATVLIIVIVIIVTGIVIIIISCIIYMCYKHKDWCVQKRDSCLGLATWLIVVIVIIVIVTIGIGIIIFIVLYRKRKESVPDTPADVEVGTKTTNNKDKTDTTDTTGATGNCDTTGTTGTTKTTGTTSTTSNTKAIALDTIDSTGTTGTTETTGTTKTTGTTDTTNNAGNTGFTDTPGWPGITIFIEPD